MFELGKGELRHRFAHSRRVSRVIACVTRLYSLALWLLRFVKTSHRDVYYLLTLCGRSLFKIILRV